MLKVRSSRRGDYDCSFFFVLVHGLGAQLRSPRAQDSDKGAQISEIELHH
jgi:hypothetical protein